MAGMITGGLLMASSPILALVCSLFGMNRAYATLGTFGIAQPQRLANSISAVLIGPTIGVGLFMIGLVVMIVSVIIYMTALRRADTAPAMAAAVKPHTINSPDCI